MPSHLGGLSFGLVSHDADMDFQGTVEGGTINHTTQPLYVFPAQIPSKFSFFLQKKRKFLSHNCQQKSSNFFATYQVNS